MKKTTNMAMTLEEPHAAAITTIKAINWLVEQFDNTAAKMSSINGKKKLELKDVRVALSMKSHAKHTTSIRTLLQKHSTSNPSRVEPRHYQALLMQMLNLLAPLTKITIFLINKCALTEMLQVILVVILLAIWLIFSIVFLIAVSQEFMYDRKHMIRKQDHSKHNLEYHESHKKEYCK
ncbi:MULTISPECIES: hypothetical protein [Clostridia]|uniref:Uncharacterized protein n=1 Tax=Laedolimicola ammoniilytica TaxID=2981771 RepID=A0ABT2RZV0_9FIRM|nr:MULTISPECIES: hypothetical protein [Clostridia]MCU6697848.1 hypothetical protein [Laedolimicola ammoniilytica]SCI49467.1 Uncharacterised protein [uncultured Clostridium sp.]